MSIYHYQGGDILRLCSYQTISEWSLPETGSDQVNYSNKDSVVVRGLASLQCGAGSIATRCHMQVEFVVGSRRAPKIFLRVLPS